MKLNSIIALSLFMMVSVASVGAVDFTFLGPYYGVVGDGPIYFNSAFKGDSVGWSNECIFFTNFNMTAGVFGSVGFGADPGVTLTVEEVIPDNLIHVAVMAAGGGEFRVYTPAKAPLNVTGATSWVYNGLYTVVVMPPGSIDVYLHFTTDNQITYYIPEWLMNAFGFLTGLTNVVGNMIALLKVFTIYLTTSIANVTTFIGSIMTFIFFFAGGVIYWFGSISSAVINVINVAGALVDGTSSAFNGVGNLWTYFGFTQWLPAIPIFLIVFWLISLDDRTTKGGRGYIELAIADLQIVSYIVGEVWGWLYLVINFVFNTAMSLASIVTGK
jgi:hypothetical protein